jgi:HNH endonuclease
MYYYDPYELIESTEFPGFYEISGYSQYAIAKDGNVVSRYTGRLLKGHEFIDFRNPHKPGYVILNLIDDKGKTKRWPRHRLVALIFKYPGIIFKDLEVNHINGIKGDDRADNLEWVTSKENTIHAFNNNLISKTKTNHHVSVRDVDTDEITKYPNINTCARDIGISVEAVLWRLKSGERKIYPERKQYRHSHDDKSWYIPEDIETELMLNGTNKKILMRKVLTNEVLEFEKLSDLASYLKLSPSVMTKWSNLQDQPVLPGFIQLKWSHDKSPWRCVNDPYLELGKSGFKRIIKVVDTKNDKSKLYLSATECARDNNILKTTLNWRLKSDGKTVYSDGNTYEYYS